jgi:hypothetical protein
MRPKRRALASAFAIAALLAWSCSGDDDASDAGDSGADGGGGALGGGGGVAATGGMLGGGSGGTGAVVDSGWGADPIWQTTGAKASDCVIERVKNASEVQVFQWKPCAWSQADCEQAVFNPKLVGPKGGFVSSSLVQDDGIQVRAGLSFDEAFQAGLSKDVAVYVTDSGALLDAFRVADINVCEISGTSLWHERFGVKVWPDNQVVKNAGFVGKLQDPADPIAFSYPTQPPGASQGFYLGSERWVWWWAPKYAYTSVSTQDGSGYVQFADTGLPNTLVYLGAPVTTGTSFLFSAFEGDDAGSAQGKIMRSDGLSPPQDYLDPGTPNERYGEPIFANSHIAWFRGVGIKDVNEFQSVEFLTSPYSENPSELSATKLLTLPSTHTWIPSSTAGGWGFAAFPTLGPNEQIDLQIWNLATGASKTHLLPDGYDLTVLLGVTRTHVWVGAADLGQSPAPYLFRILRE